MRVQKWGNSLALRIPNAFASELNLKPGSPVGLSLDGGRLVILPTPDEYSLKGMLAEITEDNIHKEVTFGRPVGKEAW
jgi:antitoxin MazE